MIAVIGGTGKLGRGLAGRLSKAGYDVVIGSRKRDKAEKSAAELSDLLENDVKGEENLRAARKASLIILSIPYSSIGDILDRIEPGLKDGDTLLSVMVPLVREDDHFVVPEMEYESASAEVQSKSPDNVSVVSAFQGVPAKMLSDFENEVDSDIPVASDDVDAKEEVFDIIEKIPGTRPIDAGSLSNSRLIEHMAAFFVELTRIHGSEVSTRFRGI